MRAIVIPLEQIIVDPERGVDLTSLPLEEAIARVKECYGTFSRDVEVSVEGGVATIVFPGQSESPDEAAVREHTKGAKLAKRGDFKRSIPFFQKAVNLSPGFVVARRDLGMSFLEANQPDVALDHLIDVLRQDPKDVWAHVLVANIFMKFKRNLEAAETYFNSALAVSPDDVYALSNYAALLMDTGRLQEGRGCFEKAISLNPDYPNPYLGFALLHARHGDPNDALTAVENLFCRTKPADSRADAVYAEGRRLFESVNLQLAGATVEQTMGFVNGLRSELTTQLGTPIDLLEDRSLEQLDAVCETAWNHRRDRHVIRYRIKQREIVPHLVAHEMEHLALENVAFQNGRARSFMVTEATITHAAKVLQDFAVKLKKNGAGTQKSEVLRMVTSGLCNQLFNCPVDMFVEHALYGKYPSLRPTQFASLGRTHNSNLQVLRNPDVARMARKSTLRANLSMNCAYAPFTDWMYNGATEYGAAYKMDQVYPIGKRLFGLFLDAVQGFTPGDEYALVDEFATVLKLTGWYEWGPARYSGKNEKPTSEAPETPEQSCVTNPALLKQKGSSSVACCLSALQLFEGMSAEEVKAVAYEIAMAGTDGIDYFSPEDRYTLRSLPGRRFTGLQLLCMMYVGFKRIEPALDTGIPLNDEYRQALAMFEQMKNKGT